MLTTLMRGALADALDDAPAAPDVAPGPLPGDDAPLLLAIVPVTCTRLSTWGESSDAVPSSVYVRPAAAPDVPAAPGVPAPEVPAAPGAAALDPLPVVASVRMNDATPEDDCAEAPGAPDAPGALGALPLDAPPRSRHPVNVIVLA